MEISDNSNKNFKTENIEIENKEYILYIGRNAKGNDEIIRRSDPESIWFHFENISSPHIILETNGDQIQKRYLTEIGNKLYKFKKNVPKNTKVIYTEVKNIKLTKTIGCVITKNTKTIK